MKRSKLLLVIVAAILLTVVVSCTDEDGSHIHKYGSWEFVNTPTLTEKGTASMKCECGKELTVTVPNLQDERTWEVVESLHVNPTCSAVGHETYASIYGKVVIDIACVEHEYGNWKITSDPTKEESGLASRHCMYGEDNEIEIPKLTDKTVWKFVKETKPTCTEVGTEEYTSVYGTVVTKVQDALGHDYGAWEILEEPTETATGNAKHVCFCGHVEEVTVPVLTDPVWELTSNVLPKCTETGSKTYESVYGSVVVTVDALGHEYGEWQITVDPTETLTGKAIRVCHCGEVDEAVLVVLTDSAWTLEESKEADYNEAGKKVYSSTYGEVVVNYPKLVAPYDNKTYSNLAFDASDDNEGFKYGLVSTTSSWNQASVTIDTTGKGLGDAFPFRGLNQFVMVDPATGSMKVVLTPYDTDEEGNVTYDESEKVEYLAYVDFETGLIVRAFHSNFNYVVLYTPFETEASPDCAVASSWDNAMAISYTYNEVTYNIFIYNQQVYFGVSFVNELDESLSANECYNASYLYVKNSDGEVIEGFAFDGEKEVVVDGYEGTYTLGDETIFVSGFGTATYKGVTGTYELTDGEFTAHLYVDNCYYELTLDKVAKTFEMVKPMVEITFVCGEYDETENVSVNKNIKYSLPVLDNETFAFKGWYKDEEYTQPVEEEFVPTQDVTLYAKWKAKVLINLVGVLEGDITSIYLGDGDVIGAALPDYNIDEVGRQKFVGWYLDEEYNESLPLEAEVGEDANNMTLYAKWEALPVYYGTYLGQEVFGVKYGTTTATFKIDENGKISGKYTGNVISYDKTTQKISWKESESSTTVNGFWFDEESGVMAVNYYSKTEIGYDYFIYSRYQTTNKVTDHYGFYCAKPGGTITSNPYARLITLETKNGLSTIFVYGDHIYSNIIVSDTTGNVFTGDKLVEQAKNSKTLVVRDASTKEMILGLAANGDNFTSDTKTVQLDPYFGTYTCGDKEVVLDGVGTIIYDGKTGTYSKTSEGTTYGFEVYLDNNKEYYQLTLDGTSAVMNKAMVTITFVVGEGHQPVESITVNMNVVVTLPKALEDNYVFNGWFKDQAYKEQVSEEFTPSENIILYGKHSDPAALTIVYNSEEDDLEIVYSVGDEVTVERPVYKKHAFVGWYTTEDFVEGTEWVSGSTISVDTTIYAKWEDAPIYNDTYLAIRLDGTSKNGGTDSAYINAGTATTKGAVLEVDPYGKAPKASYPFSAGDVVIENYNAETGMLDIMVGSSVYKAYIEKETGFIVMNGKSGNLDLHLGFFLVKDLNANRNQFSCSYWNSGYTKVLEYTTEEKTYRYLITDATVYADVKFVDIEGNAITANNCFKSNTVVVLDKDNNVIAKYGYDGTTMVALDGNEGTYTNGDNSVVVDGIEGIKVDGVKGTYVALETPNTLGVYNENGYFEVTLNKEAMTYTIVKPMVTIKFSSEHDVVVADQLLNKNIEVTLPTPTTTGFKFRGWYFDAELNEPVGEKYTPILDVTLYAKWDEEVVLTVVYGNTLEDVTLTYGAGDTVAPVEPVYTNGLVFEGWYTNEACTEKYTIGVITESMTIYCKWMEATPLYGSYAGANVYGSINCSSGKTLTVDPLGNVSGSASGIVTEFDTASNTFEVLNGSLFRFGCCDLVNGVVAVRYSTSVDEKLGIDYNVFVKGATKVTGDTSKSVNIGSGDYRLVTLNITKDGTTSTMLLYVSPTSIYGNVTFTGADTVKAAATASNLQIFDCNGNLIATFNGGKLA